MRFRYQFSDNFSKFIIVFLCSGIVFCYGCHSYDNSGIATIENQKPSKINLAPGDIIEVQFYYTPELNDNQTIRPDGKISLQLVGDVEVEGKSPDELREDLLKLYEPHLKDPQINVVIRSLPNRLVYVGGQVAVPGIVEMPGPMSLMEAIIQAGGLDYQKAEVKNIVVIRHTEDKRLAYSVNLEPVLKGKETDQFMLEPKDIVYVSQSKIVEINQWVDQHINRLIPQTGFFFTRNFDNTFLGIDTSRRY